MQKFHQILPILAESGFQYLSKIFNKYNTDIFCVGGSVRDCFTGNSNILDGDMDLAVPIPPVRIIEILEMETVKYFTMGIEFGTVTAHYNQKNYEITSFRQDIKTDGRHAVVSYTSQMELDAKRRDFTMNALYYDNKGIIYDPLGYGLLDLQQKKVHFIGHAQERICEDYLRILRYFRFLARFGMDSYQPDIFKHHDYTNGLQMLSEHRVSHELKKIIQYSFAANAISEIITLGYDNILFRGLKLNISVFSQYKNLKCYNNYLLSSLFFHNNPLDIKKSLLFSKKEKNNINKFATLYHIMQKLIKEQEWISIIELQYDYDIALWHDLLLLFQSNYVHLQEKIKTIKQIILPPFTLTGRILLEQGYKQGIDIARNLQQKRTEFVVNFLKNNSNLL